MPDVVGYLHSKGLAYRNATRQNVHLACVFCNEDPHARGRLYINVDPDADPAGLYKCHRCGVSGNLTTLKRHFGDRPTERELDSATRAQIFNAAAAHYAERLIAYPSVEAWLKGPERGLLPATVADHQLGYAAMEISYNVATRTSHIARPNGLYLHLRDAGHRRADILATGLCQEHEGRVLDSLAGMVTIPYLVAGQVVTIRGRTWPHDPADFATWDYDRYDPPKAKYKTLGGTGTRLYNTDVLWDTSTVAICEGEFDALVLEQAGFPAVGVPGAQAWQEEWDDYFPPIKRIWLIYDRDAAGERGATKLAERFGTKIRRVHLSAPGVKCDPTTWFQTHNVADFAELLADASKGGLLVTVADAVDEFRAVQSQPGLRLGWEEVDDHIRPGLQPAQLMVVLARTSAGKTIFLLNVMQRIRLVPGQEDTRMLFLSLEQTRGEWWDRARRIYRFYHPTHTEADAIRYWQNNIRLVDSNHLTSKQLTQVLDDYEYDLGGLPNLICLDYLAYWGRGFAGEAYERTTAAIHGLKRIIKEYRIPLIVPQQVSRSAKDGEEFGADVGRDSGAVEETADFLLGMWRPDDQLGRENTERNGEVYFKILKSRHGGRGQKMTLQWSPASLVLVPRTDSTRLVRARHELAWHRMYPAETWEELVLRHDLEPSR